MRAFLVGWGQKGVWCGWSEKVRGRKVEMRSQAQNDVVSGWTVGHGGHCEDTSLYVESNWKSLKGLK